MPVINVKTTFDINPTLAGAPGNVDPNTPIKVEVTPADAAIVENILINTDGSLGSFDITATAPGEVTYLVTADKNLAAGILDLTATGVIQFVAEEVIGADALTVAERPAA